MFTFDIKQGTKVVRTYSGADEMKTYKKALQWAYNKCADSHPRQMSKKQADKLVFDIVER